ncbi:MAG: hypothetical protein M3Q10_02330 [Chloroflexota bacterium]|nr:hypothetical protein [Chloroflexota bacterium]
MTTRTDQRPDTPTTDEDDAAFWARAAEYGFVRPEQIDPDQAWFWTREWIEGEIEAEIAIAEGRTTFYGSDEEFLNALEERMKCDADVRGGEAISEPV